VYNGVKPDQALSNDYIQKANAALRRNIVLGGLRLAYVIQNIFGGARSEFDIPEEV